MSLLRVTLGVVGSLPFLALLYWWVPVLVPLSETLDGWFAFHCHQDPQRTLALGDHRFPVCARCTGIYSGILVGAAAGWPRASIDRLGWLTLIGAVLLLADVGTEALGWRVPSLATRWATGFGFAYGAVLLGVRAWDRT